MKKRGLIILLFCLSMIYTYAQTKLSEEQLIEQYGTIRKEMVLKACEYCNYTDKNILGKIDIKSVKCFQSALDTQSDIYKTVASSSKQLYGSDIIEYSNALIASDTLFVNNLVYLYAARKDDIKKKYNIFLTRIEELTQECNVFNSDNNSYRSQYPNGRFIKLLMENKNIKQDDNKEELEKLKEENEKLKKENEELKKRDDKSKQNNSVLIDGDKEKEISSIIWRLILVVLGIFGCFLCKKYNKKFIKIIQLLLRKNKANNKIQSENCNMSTESSGTDSQSSSGFKKLIEQNGDRLEKKDETSSDKPKEDEDTKGKRDNRPPQLPIEKFAIENNEWIVVGASVIGRGHVDSNIPCQDSNTYANLGNGWGIAITSDGAGSAKYSDVGSKIVVTRTKVYFEQLILDSSWYKNNSLPDDITWSKMVFKALKAVRDDLQRFADGTPTHAKFESFAATVIVVIHTSVGLLVAHIGDGRAGYQDKSGNWHSLIIPHKGEEANQTIFITSDFWNIPFYEMSGVSVPETRVIRECVKSFVLMSDGCEHTSWDCNLYNADRGIYYDPNAPHAPFFNPLIETLKEQKKDKLSFDDRSEKWYNYLNRGNKSFVKETDDKTMILGTIS